MRTVRWSIGQRENTPGKGHGLGQGNGAPNKCAEMRNKFELNSVPLFQRAYYHLVSVSMLLVRPENLQYRKLACAYGNLKADDLHRTIIYVFHIVCT